MIVDVGVNMLIFVRKVEEEVKRYNFCNMGLVKLYFGGVIVVGEMRLFYIDDVIKVMVELKFDKVSIFVKWVEYNV